MADIRVYIEELWKTRCRVKGERELLGAGHAGGAASSSSSSSSSSPSLLSWRGLRFRG
jgi:hypothetical protein